MKLSRLVIPISTILAVGISGTANAVVGLGISPSAMTPIASVATNMGSSASMTAIAITKAATDASASISSSSGSVNQAIVQSSMKNSMDNARLTSMQVKMEMDFDSELANKKIEAQRGGRVGEVKEDVKYVLDFLKNPKYSNLNTSVLIDYAKKNLDGKDIIVAPRIDKSGNCDGGKCGFKKPLEVSKMLEYYAPLCADAKRQTYKQELLNKSEMTTRISSARDIKNLVSNTSSVATSNNRIQRDLAVSCAPDMMKIGACGDIARTKDEYVNYVLQNKIIPNGNVSAINFYSPTSIGGLGYIDINSENRGVVADYAKNALDDSHRGGADVPIIVDTYRNSSQLKSALSFVDNVINLEAISNQSVSDRLKIRSAGFQNRYLSRVATLSLAKNVMNDSVAARRGRTLSMYDTNSADFVKESSDGGSYADIERYDIQKGLDSFSPANIKNMQEMTEKQITVEMYKAQAKANSILWQRVKDAELQSLLLSSLVSGEANSPENLSYIRSIDS